MSGSEHCRDCTALTSGLCWRHSTFVVTYGPTQPSPMAIAEAVREAAAQEVDRIVRLMGEGAGDYPRGHRLNQAARLIRSLDLSSILAGLGK